MKRGYVDLPELPAYCIIYVPEVPEWLIVNTAARPNANEVLMFPPGRYSEKEAKALHKRLSLYPGKAAAISFK